jgi:hypothetical protein
MFLAENQSLEYTPNIDIVFWSAIIFYLWFILFDSPAQPLNTRIYMNESNGLRLAGKKFQRKSRIALNHG